MNAILQVLFHCEPFRENMIKCSGESDREEEEGDLLQQVSILFDRVIQSAKDEVFSPQGVHDAVCAANGNHLI
jgi:hypothetical protein